LQLASHNDAIVDDRVEVWGVFGHADRSMFNNVPVGGSMSALSTLDISLSAEHYH